MTAGEAFAIGIPVGWAACLGFQALWLRIIEFAADRLREDALCNGPHGDVPFVPANDFEPAHFTPVASGAPHDPA
jgi:hypothetical protein